MHYLSKLPSFISIRIKHMGIDLEAINQGHTDFVALSDPYITK